MTFFGYQAWTALRLIVGSHVDFYSPSILYTAAEHHRRNLFLGVDIIISRLVMTTLPFSVFYLHSSRISPSRQPE